GYAGRGRDAFDSDAAVRDAVVYQIVVLGEAAKAVVQADQTVAEGLKHDGIEWSLLARMRDRLTHQYWRTDADIVWATATQDIPKLRAALIAAISRLKST
ncbi:MAG: HepT-like ribonuclease domain-containing protein, partial [Gemmatimonadaceae bacterium]